jgi:predicted nucleotidyltransferase
MQGFNTNFDFAPTGKARKKKAVKREEIQDDGLPPIVESRMPARQEEIVRSIVFRLTNERQVKACFLLGSLAKDMGDELSDIDMTIVVADSKGDKWFATMKTVIEDISPTLIAIRTDISKRSAVFVFPDLIELDVAVVEESELNPSPAYADIKAVFDPESIAKFVQIRSSKLPKRARVEAIISTESHFYWGVLAVRKRLLRDNVWDARDALEKLRYLIIRMIDLGEGTLNGYKGIERKLDSKTLLRLSKTAPQYDKDAILSALSAIVDLFTEIRDHVFDSHQLIPNKEASRRILELLRDFR